MPDYSVRIAGDNLVYSAAHFILLPDGECEPLHGHNYRVAVEVAGPLDDCGCVVDFAAVLRIARSVLAQIDHAVLLPARSTRIRLAEGESEVEVRFESRRWVFPRRECRLLPLECTTVELMAGYLAARILEGFSAGGLPRPRGCGSNWRSRPAAGRHGRNRLPRRRSRGKIVEPILLPFTERKAMLSRT